MEANKKVIDPTRINIITRENNGCLEPTANKQGRANLFHIHQTTTSTVHQPITSYNTIIYLVHRRRRVSRRVS